MIDANITAQLVVDNDKVVGTLTDRGARSPPLRRHSQRQSRAPPLLGEGRTLGGDELPVSSSRRRLACLKPTEFSRFLLLVLFSSDYIAKVVLGRGANNSRQQPEPVPDALGDGPTPHVSTRSMVADVMTPAATSADVELIGSPDTRVLQALRVMGEKGIRMLPVMEGQKLLGFLTYFDLVRGRAAAPVPLHRSCFGGGCHLPPPDPLASGCCCAAIIHPCARLARLVPSELLLRSPPPPFACIAAPVRDAGGRYGDGEL